MPLPRYSIVLFWITLPLVGSPPQSYPFVSSPTPAIQPAQGLEESLKKQSESLEKQRQALSRQINDKSGSVRLPTAAFITPLAILNQADCPALDEDRVNELVSVAARNHSLDPDVLRAVMRQESGFKPCALSSKGAGGLMQLMPGTARELRVGDVFDPEQNVRAGAAYLKQLLERYKGDLRLALAGYNAGPGRADQPGGSSFPLETQNYIAHIFSELGLPGIDQDPLEERSSQNESEHAPPVDLGEAKVVMPMGTVQITDPLDPSPIQFKALKPIAKPQ